MGFQGHRQVISSSLLLGLSGVLWAALAGAPSAASTTAQADPLAEQLKAGATVFSQKCQGCHGDKLQGNRAPALIGDEIAEEFTGAEHPYADLHTKVSKTMPRNAPGSLTEQQYLDVVAFVFSKNGVALPQGGLTKDNLQEAALTGRAAQVKAGASVYAQKCQGCHGDKLQGNRAPTLKGADFLAHWDSVGDLHTKVSKTMPRNAPGTLSAQQYLDVVAFLLDQNKAAGGKNALNSDDFKTKLK